MGVGIHRHTDVRVPHKVLKSLWIHSGSCHIAAVGMLADMRRDVRKLYAEDVVVSLDCVLETVFPVQGYKRQASVISEKESDVTMPPSEVSAPHRSGSHTPGSRRRLSCRRT